MTINRITFLREILETNYFAWISIPVPEFLHMCDTLEIKYFLDYLEKDKTYVVTFDFIISKASYRAVNPFISLSEPIVITRNSNARLISNYIFNRINIACNTYCLDEDLFNMLSTGDGPGVIAKYSEIKIF